MIRTHTILLTAVAGLILSATAAHADDDIPSLIAKLGCERAKPDRIAAAKALGDSKDKRALRAVKALTAGCKDRDAEIRSASVVALGLLVHRHNQRCPLVIVELMFDSDATVRTNAGGLVSIIDDLPPEGTALLYKNVNHTDPVIRSDVMTPLARADGRNPKVIKVLEKATRDADAGVRVNAVAGLWQATGDLSRLVPLWLRLLEDAPPGNPTDRQGTLRQLGAIAGATKLRELGVANPKEIAAELVKSLTDKSPQMRRAAARSLGAMAGETAKARRVLRKAGVERALKPLLDDPDESVQTATVIVLENFKKKKTTPP
jgi:HEAT repeat protein